MIKFSGIVLISKQLFFFWVFLFFFPINYQVVFIVCQKKKKNQQQKHVPENTHITCPETPILRDSIISEWRIGLLQRTSQKQSPAWRLWVLSVFPMISEDTVFVCFCFNQTARWLRMSFIIALCSPSPFLFFAVLKGQKPIPCPTWAKIMLHGVA